MSLLTESIPGVRSSSSTIDAWFTRCPVSSPFSIALHLGWIHAEFAHDPGVTFRALQTSRDPKVHHAHYAHNHPNLFRHGGNYPAIWANANGANTRVIGLSWRHTSHSILALPGSGIKTAADLKGKRLHVVRRPKEDIDFGYATTLRTYEAALESVGLTFADVKLVEHNIDRSLISDRVQHGSPDYVTFNKNPNGGRGTENIWGLLNREADVIVGPNNLVELLGLDLVFETESLALEKQFNNPNPLTFAVNAELIEAHPDFVTRVYVRALQAVEWAKNNRAEAIRFVAKEQGQPEHKVAEDFGDGFQVSLEIGLEPKYIAALRNVKAFLLRHGFIKQDFSLEAWIDPRPLAAARLLLEERRFSADYQAEIAPGAGAIPSTR